MEKYHIITNPDRFQPPSTAADIFRLGSLMVFLLTNGNTWIKSHEDAAAVTSTSLQWLHARYSSDLMSLLGRMLSNQPEERPTAEEIEEETDNTERQQEPELISANQLDEFLDLQEQLVALLPKQRYQHHGETYTFEQWKRSLSEEIAGLRKPTGRKQGRKQTSDVINVSALIDMLSDLLDYLQDPMTGENLAKACSLLKKIEKLAKIKDE